MSKYSTKKEVYQSYFKNMCKTFCVAYKEVKRLEKQKKEIAEKSQSEEYKMVRELLKIKVPEEIIRKYIDKRYTIEMLKKEKEKLKEIKDKADERKNEVDEILKFWIKEYANCISNITEIIEQMEEKNFLITVTCKEEVITLMEYFAQNSVKEHRIINQEEKSLKKFPTGDEICKEFYEAYTMEDDDKMTEVIKKYF